MQIRKRRFFKSYPMRLTMTIVLVVSLILFVGAAINRRAAVNAVFDESSERMQTSISNTILRIDNVLKSVEVAVNNLSWVIQDNLDDTDFLYRITRQLVEDNDFVYGSSIAFEPSYYRKEGIFFAPYSYRNGDEICSKQLGSDDYDYHYMDWYQIPKLLGKPYWSEPYFDKGGGEKIMTTYSLPLYDADDELIAILTADISLEWLTEQINSIKIYPTSYSLLVGRGGAFLMHDDSDAILTETIFSQAMADNNQQQINLGHLIVNGVESIGPILFGDTIWVVAHAPIKATGWSVVLACPESEIFAQLIRMSRLITILAIVMLALMSIMCFISIRAMTKPLVQFADSAKDIARGNFNARLPDITSEDEMKTLHDSFVYMQDSLTRYVDELKKTTTLKAGMDRELRIARIIQMDLVPKKFPDSNVVDLNACLIPAKAVGGDLYDFFIEGDKLNFILGDVSGKGIPASLVMAVICRLFHTIAANTDDVAQIVRNLNDSISESNESNMFCTAMVGILDLKTGYLQYCNAGHNPSIIKEKTGQAHYLDVIPNLPLGVWHGFEYQKQECYLKEGSILVIYTDGITESVSLDGSMYSDARLMDYLSRNSFNNSKDLVDSLLADVNARAAGAEQSDDITLLCVSLPSRREDSKPMHITLKNNIEEIARMTDFIEDICEQKDLDAAARFNIRLALEEAVTNVIMYAFPEGETHEFDITVQESENSITFRITDNGKEFDPTSLPEPDTTLPAEERPLGGLGIFLIRRVMDKVEYSRVDGINVLTLVKNITNEIKE